MADHTGNDKAVRHKIRDEDYSAYPRHSIGDFLTLCSFGSERICPKLERFLSTTHLSL